MSGIAESLYLRSPLIIQKAAVAIWGVQWYRRRFNPEFSRYVQELKEREYWPKEKLRQYQCKQLQELFRAAKASPYYREYQLPSLNEEVADPLEALSRLPILTKQTLRAVSEDLITESRIPRGTIKLHTSGTTGTPVTLYYTRQFHALQLAVIEARTLHAAGVNHRSRRVMFGARHICSPRQEKPPFWRLSPVENMAYMSIYHMSEANLEHYVRFLSRFKPTVVMGFPSALDTLARYILSESHVVPEVKCIITMSETLSEQVRTRLEQAWGCRVWDRYGSVEGCAYISQCEYRRYHISTDFGIVEILDDAGEVCSPGQAGQLVCTGLHNTLQPLIRYRIGDFARIANDQHCECGRSTPIIEGVEGRTDDICWSATGEPIHRFDPVFKGIESVREAQVIQNESGSFTVIVVPDGQLVEMDVVKIRHAMAQLIGNHSLEVLRVSAIPRTSSGKFRAVICKYKPGVTENTS